MHRIFSLPLGPRCTPRNSPAIQYHCGGCSHALRTAPFAILRSVARPQLDVRGKVIGAPTPFTSTNYRLLPVISALGAFFSGTFKFWLLFYFNCLDRVEISALNIPQDYYASLSSCCTFFTVHYLIFTISPNSLDYKSVIIVLSTSGTTIDSSFLSNSAVRVLARL